MKVFSTVVALALVVGAGVLTMGCGGGKEDAAEKTAMQKNGETVGKAGDPAKKAEISKARAAQGLPTQKSGDMDIN